MSTTIDAGPFHLRQAPIEADLTLIRALQVRNVVASARVSTSLCVADLAATIPGAAFDRRVCKLVVRFASPKSTALVFGSGKVVLTGLHDPAEAAPALAAVLAVLRVAGADIYDPPPAPEVVNVVASGNLGDGIALNRLAISRNFDRVEFDPEQFPGLVYRSEAGPVALIFGTGSLVITGARSIEGARAVGAEVREIVSAAGAWSRSDPGTSVRRVRLQRQRSP